MAFADRIIGIKRRWMLVLGLLLAAGVGSGFGVSNAATADTQDRQRPQHFKSGSERSLLILSEIRDTLKQMDARLKRIEQTVLTAATKEAARQPVRADTAR